MYVEKPIYQAILKTRFIHVLEEEVKKARIAQKEPHPKIIKSKEGG